MTIVTPHYLHSMYFLDKRSSGHGVLYSNDCLFQCLLPLTCMLFLLFSEVLWHGRQKLNDTTSYINCTHSTRECETEFHNAKALLLLRGSVAVKMSKQGFSTLICFCLGMGRHYWAN